MLHSVYGDICLGIILFLLCFIPFVVADARKHNNKLAILALGVLLGWTFLGWVAALVWALTDNVKKEPGV